MVFRLGDSVQWTGRASGHVCEHVGKIVAVIPAGELSPPHHVFERVMFDDSLTRGHESYIVRDDGTDWLHRPLYRPRVKSLKLLVRFEGDAKG